MPAIPIQAKFRCALVVQKFGTQLVKLYPAGAGPDASEEDRAFWRATPNGSLEMFITNEKTEDFFVEGRDYRLTFEPVS